MFFGVIQVSGDRVASVAEKPTQHDDRNGQSDGCLADNVFHPFINGTGVRQIADTFTGTDYKPLSTGQEHNFFDSAVQTVSSTVGAIAPYIVLGKLTHGRMSALADRQGLKGLAG